MAIEVKDLSYIYQKNTVFAREALAHINLSVKKGEFVGILGASGSGKSTLLQHLNGVMASKGKITVNGISLGEKGLSRRSIVSNVTMAFQYPEHQLVADTVGEELRFGCEKLGYSKERIDALVAQYAEIFHFSQGFLLRSPFHLSGGEKRRVALASIFAMDTPILLLDEPTVGLDPQGRGMFSEIMKELFQSGEKTVLWVGHDIGEIAKIATRLIVMAEGRIVLDDNTDVVLRETELLEKWGILTPQSRVIQKELTARYGDDLKTEDGQKILSFLMGKRGDDR